MSQRLITQAKAADDNAFAKQLKDADIKQSETEEKAEEETEQVSEKKVYEVKIDALGRSYGTGKRKSSIARVWIKPGKGEIIVNGRQSSEYFKRAIFGKGNKQTI